MSRNNPIFNLPIVDAKEYVDDASYYNDVSWLGPPGSYFHPPGYSYFIGIIFLFFGKHLIAIRLVHILMDVANIYVVYKIAEKVFDKRVALISALLYAIYVRMIQYSVEILPPVLVIFLLLMSIYFLISSNENNKTKSISLSAFFLGLLLITLPNFILVIPVFVLWIYSSLRAKQSNLTEEKAPLPKIRFIMILFIVIALFPVVLTATRNRMVADESLLISRNGGVNLYLGNNPNIKKTVGATPGIEWEKLLMLPYQTTRIANFKQQDDFFSDKAFDYIKNNFGDWIQLMLKKTLWFFNAHEFPRNFNVYYFAEFSFITKYPILNFAAILPLALAGMFFGFKKSIPFFKENLNRLLLTAIVLIYSFSIVLIFIAARYRLPIIPLLIIFASAFLVLLYDKFQEKNFKMIGIGLGITMVLFFFTQKKYFEDEYSFHASPVFTRVLIANTLQNAGRSEEAKSYLEDALKLPTDESTDEALFELGHFYRSRDKIKAEELFMKAVKLDTTNYKAWNSLGFDYKMEGKFQEAIGCLQKGISAAPCFPELYLNLADCYLIRKNMDSAVVILESYYKNCPSPHPNISTPLGKIYMDVYKNIEKAKKYYEESVLYPQGEEISAETFNRLGSCYFQLGEKQKAKETWMKGLEIEPQNKAIKINISFAEKQTPDWNSL